MNERAVVEQLRTLVSADVDAADESACGELLGMARSVRGAIDAAEALITSRVRQLHDTAGGAPAADTHARCGGVSAAEGRRKDRRSEVIDAAPSFGEALGAGTVVAEHVHALAASTSKLDVDMSDQVFEHVDDLLADAVRLTPERFGRSVRDLVRRLERDAGLGRNRRQRRDTFLSRRLNAATGMIEGRYAFHPELANQVFGAVDREVAAMLAEGERRGTSEFARRRVDRNQLAAEALGRLVAGGHQQQRPLEADITVIVDHRTLADGPHDGTVCETSDAAELPPASMRRLVCQGRVTPVIVGADGTALDAGRTIRHANRQQRRALRAMYRSCAFGQCDVSFGRCEIHHVLPWELGGATDLRNLVPLCSRHHHTVHESGWTLELTPDRTLTISRPDGSVFAVAEPDVPPSRSPARTRRRVAA